MCLNGLFVDSHMLHMQCRYIIYMGTKRITQRHIHKISGAQFNKKRSPYLLWDLLIYIYTNVLNREIGAEVKYM